jgi:nickel-dependent lactate racemase
MIRRYLHPSAVNFKWQNTDMIQGQNLVRIELRYGEGTLPIEIPHGYITESISPRTIVDFPNCLGEINRFLENPTNSEPLSRLMSRAKTAAVVVNSEQDIELNRNFLSIMLDILRSSMTRPTDIVLLFSPPSNTSFDLHEINQRLGEPMVHGHELVLHNPKDDENLCYVGDTSTFSTPVFINKAFAESDIRIGIGTIRHNIFLGATGGRLSVIPHVSGVKTILRNLKIQATNLVGPFNTNSAACTDMDEISQIAGLDFILNAVPDRNGSIASIIAGEPYTAWRQGVDIARTLSEAPIHHKADIAIVSPGGTQFDSTLYNAADSLFAAKEATEFGGVIVLVAECIDGPGPDGFLKGVSECRSEHEASFLAETNFESGMEKAPFFVSILSSRKLIICSRLRESMIVEHFRSQAVSDPQEGLQLAKEGIVSKPRIAVIPQGNRTLPISRTR